jgi:putative hemolysin
MKWTLPLTIVVILLSACSINPTKAVQPTNEAEEQVVSDTPQASMPNPASVYCTQQGYLTEIRTADDGSQAGTCIFPDGSECDEWAYYRGECAPASQSVPTSSPIAAVETVLPVLTEFPTAMPIDPADYQGWWTYTHAVYNFSIMLPEDWIVDETTTADPLMNGYMLILHPKDTAPGFVVERENIRLTFRRMGEEVRLWPTGVGQGEFIEQGSLDIAGSAAQRMLLVCPTGEVTSIWYHQGDGGPNIVRGDLEFGFIFSAGAHCEAGYSLVGKIQRLGEMMIASLKVP